MRLTRIRLENVRQYARLEISDLEPGLNLFVGPNGTGKTSLVAAIRAAFFERYRTKAIEHLQGHDTGCGPSVCIEFTRGDVPYRLTKTFLKKASCKLEVGSHPPQVEDEAEAELAQLFGYAYAGSGESKAQHQGIPGLLWVQQGTGQDIHGAVAHAADQLQGALHSIVAEVASTEGDALIATVATKRNALLTPKNDKPTGVYAEALAALIRARESLESDEARSGEYAAQVDRLAALKAEHARQGADQPWVGYRQQAQKLKTQLAEIDVQRAEANRLGERADAEQRRADMARDRLRDFGADETALQARRAELEQAQQALDDATAALAPWDARVQAGVQACERAHAELQRARRAREWREAVRRRDSAGQALAPTRHALEQARAAEADLAVAKVELAACAPFVPALADLRERHAMVATLRAHLDGAASRVHFDLRDGATVLVDGTPITGSMTRVITDASVIDLGGLGSMVIEPGGNGLVEGRRALEVAQDDIAAVLRALGVTDIAAVQAGADAHARWKEQVAEAGARLNAHAPDGIDALQTRLRVLERDLDAAEAALGDEMHADWADAPAVDDAQAALDAAQSAQRSLEREQATARDAVTKAALRVDAATTELAAVTTRVQSPERRTQHERLEQDMAEALGLARQYARDREAHQAHVEAAQPALLQQDVTRLEASASAAEKAYQQCVRDLDQTSAWLESHGVAGIEEQLAARRRDLEQAERRATELERHARALDHLHKLLLAERETLTRQLQAPLQRRFDYYVRLLFPNGGLEVRADLTPGTLQADTRAAGGAHEFDALSFGTREQLGILSRLAYADLLKEAGRPTLLILDDVLVHSDTDRLQAMKRVLWDAATRHQILLLSCHPDRWRDLGVEARPLERLTA